MSRTAARIVAERLVAAGHRTVFAGGCVRDRLLERPVHDIDIATAARPEEVMALFERTVPVGESFGVVKVLQDGEAFDVATFRTDLGILDGRHPAEVRPATLEEDVLRRDFTINALVEDPTSGEILDLVEGLPDLRAGVLRAIGEPALRFREDALRLLRAVRFASTLGFRVEPATLEGMRAEAGGLCNVSGERIRDELARMLAGPGRVAAVRLLIDAALVEGALPECSAGLAQPTRLQSLLGVLAALPARVALPLALAALVLECGDVGRQAAAAEALAARLRLSRQEATALVDLVTLAPRLESLAADSRAARRRLLGHAHADDLLALHAARVPEGEALRALAAERERLDGRPALPEALLGGHDVLALGVDAGPRLGRILGEAYELQLQDEFADRDEALAWLAERLRR